MFSLYIISDDRTPAIAVVKKSLLPWIFVGQSLSRFVLRFTQNDDVTVTQRHSRAPGIHESCKICSNLLKVLRCEPFSELRWERFCPSKICRDAALIWFLNVGSSSLGLCRCVRPCVCLLIPAWMLSFLSLEVKKKRHRNQNIKKDTHSACICLNTVLQYIFSRHLWFSPVPFPLEQLSFVGFCVFSAPLSLTHPFPDSLSCCKCI